MPPRFRKRQRQTPRFMQSYFADAFLLFYDNLRAERLEVGSTSLRVRSKDASFSRVQTLSAGVPLIFRLD